MPTRATTAKQDLELGQAAALLSVPPAALLLLVVAGLLPARFDAAGRLTLRRQDLRRFSVELAAQLSPGQSFSRALSLLIKRLKTAHSAAQIAALQQLEPLQLKKALGLLREGQASPRTAENGGAITLETEVTRGSITRARPSTTAEQIGRLPRKARQKRREDRAARKKPPTDKREPQRRDLLDSTKETEEREKRQAEKEARRQASRGRRLEEERARRSEEESAQRLLEEAARTAQTRTKSGSKRRPPTETASSFNNQDSTIPGQGTPSNQPVSGRFQSFNTVLDELKIDEEELKKLASQDELRGFRDGLSIKFETDEVRSLKESRETEPTSILTDSEQEAGASGYPAELVLEDSTAGTVVDIDVGTVDDTVGDIMGGEKLDQQEVVFDSTEEFSVSPRDSEKAKDSVFVWGADEDNDRALKSKNEEASVDATRAFERTIRRSLADPEPAFTEDLRAPGPSKAGSSALPDDPSSTGRAAPSFNQSLPIEGLTLSTERFDDGLDQDRRASTAPIQPAPPPSQPAYSRRPPSGLVPEQVRSAKRGGLGIAGAIIGAPLAGLGALAGAAARGAGAAGRAVAKAAKSEAPANAADSTGSYRSMKPAAPPPPQPKPKPVQASPAPPQGQKQQIEIEEVQRRTTVRYYKQMYTGKNYPLFVIISQHKIKKIIDVLIGQASSKKAFNIKKSNPIVHIRPIFPGCHCVPLSQDLDVTERIAESQFWLTPTAVGPLEDAKVEILYEGKVVDTIPIAAVATTQARAKISGSLAFVTTTFGPAFKTLGAQLSEHGAGWVGDMLSFAGSSNAPYITSGVLAASSALFYVWNRPQKAPDLEAFFDYEAAQGPPGDPQVIAQRCRLVLLSRSQRHIFEIGELLTTFGKASDRLIRLTERGIENQHCALRFDPDRQVFSIEAGRGPVEVDGVAVEANQDLRRDAVLKLGNEVSLWFFDERSDEAGLDNPTKRHQAQQILERELASFVPKIRAAFADPKHKTVRRVVAALMVEGILTPQHWSRLRRASGL